MINFTNLFSIPFTNLLFISGSSRYKFPKIPLRSILSLLYSYFKRSLKEEEEEKDLNIASHPLIFTDREKERIFHNPRAIIPFWNALPLIPRKQCNYDRREQKRRGSIPRENLAIRRCVAGVEQWRRNSFVCSWLWYSLSPFFFLFPPFFFFSFSAAHCWRRCPPGFRGRKSYNGDFLEVRPTLVSSAPFSPPSLHRF